MARWTDEKLLARYREITAKRPDGLYKYLLERELERRGLKP